MNEKKISFFILFIFFTILTYIVLNSELCYHGGDNFIHYKFARYAYLYPWFFLDHWGKPLFTFCSAPFAQFGFHWVKFFNLLVGLSAAYFAYLTASSLKLKNAWITIVFVCCSPIYFMMFNTCLTEILFSFVLIVSIFLFSKKKYTASALLISFIPFARTEGFLIIFFFSGALLFINKIKLLPFLIAGSLFYTVIGFFYYHDILWIITKIPYLTGSNIYGKGELLHFIKSYNDITGILITIFVLTGCILIVKNSFLWLKLDKLKFASEVILIFLLTIGYVTLHSVAWWKGALNSLGEIRVMAGIVPVMSLVALRGFNFIGELLRYSFIKKLLLLFCITFLVYNLKSYYLFGYKLNDEQLLIKKATEWLKNSQYMQNKIYYYDPSVFLLLNLNPFDDNRCREKIPNYNRPENEIKEGEIIFWDAHYAPNEGETALNRLLENKCFKLIKLFQPDSPFKTLGNYYYEIYIFQRVLMENSNTSNYKILKEWNFEKVINADSLYVSSEQSSSGKYSFKLTHEKLYSPAFEAFISELREKGIENISISIALYPVFEVDKNTSLIMSIENDSIYFYKTIGFETINPKIKNWNKLSYNLVIPDYAKDNDKIKIYIYQAGSKYIYIDDFIIKYF